MRLVVVSNRVPAPDSGNKTPGGLAVALSDATKRGSLWFGWSGTFDDGEPAPARIEESRGITWATIDLGHEEYKQFYVGFSNGALWPLLHFRVGLFEYDRADYEGYKAVNAKFADALQPLLRDDDVVWAHDYHLFPLATELRRRGVTQRLGFFLHIPFVPGSLFSVLPCAGELIENLLDYDVLGFQTELHRRDFCNAAMEILGAEVAADGTVSARGRTARTIACPIGINPDAFAKMAVQAEKGRECKRLRDSMQTSVQSRSLIIGAERMDYSKGLPNRLAAYERFLERNPGQRGKVNYLQIAPVSRGEVKEYQRLRRDLDRQIGEINGRFAEFDWVPVRYMARAVGRKTLAGFYRFARVGLVTPLRDGMNLVAKEYVAAQNPEDPGVLILSRFAGAADVMTDALLVNPYDADDIADALQTALSMPVKERRARYENLMQSVQGATAMSFCRDFLAALSMPDPIAADAAPEPLPEPEPA